jgi:archaemetzincin
MKHILITLTIITLFSCNSQPKKDVPWTESGVPELESLGKKLEKMPDIDDTLSQHYIKILKEKENSEIQSKVESSVHIKGLGKYDQKDVNKVAQYVEKFFGYTCIMEEGVPTNSKMYYGGTDLDVSQCVFELNKHGIKTIYVTNENLVNKGQQIRGGTFLRCNTVIVEHTDYDESTVLHEIGHTLGLVHCDNPKCLMAIDNDLERKLDFCEKCKKRLKDENIQ